MKKSTQVLFETNMKEADAIHSGIIFSGNKEIIKISTGTNSHNAKSNEWLAEQLLLSFISTAFMRTLLMLVAEKNISIDGFECEAIADAVLTNKIPEIIAINIYPKIYVEDERKIKEVKELVDRTIKNNPAEKMFDAITTYHPVIEIRSMPGILN